MKRYCLASLLSALATGALGQQGTLIVAPKMPLPSGMQVVRSYPERNRFVIRVPAGRNTVSYQKELQSSGRYAWVSENPLCYPCRRPNDPQFIYQWHHTKLESERSWDIRTGLGSSVKVGLVDSGVDLTHPDLVASLVSGWDMESNLSQQNGGDVQDYEGHGTEMAGLIAAAGNNAKGVVGMGWGLKIMPIRVSADGVAPLDRLLASAEKAADLGCQVVNVSYTGVANIAVSQTGDYCASKGSMLVWAAGNTNTQLTGFDYTNVMIVGATDASDQVAPNTAWGSAVDVYAPGTAITSTTLGGGYGVGSGTSDACAMVSGIAAMMRWVNPYMTFETWSNNLVRGTEDVGAPGSDPVFKWGRINAFRAVRRVVPFAEQFISPPAGYRSPFAVDINDAGQVCALLLETSSSKLFAWTIDAAGSHVLAPLAGFDSSRCVGLTGQGKVYGTSIRTSDNYEVATVWDSPNYAPRHLSVTLDGQVYELDPRDVSKDDFACADVIGHPTVKSVRLSDESLAFSSPSQIKFVATGGWACNTSGIFDPSNTFTPVTAPGYQYTFTYSVNRDANVTALGRNNNAFRSVARVNGTWYPLSAPFDQLVLGSIDFEATDINDDNQISGYYRSNLPELPLKQPAIWNFEYAENINRLRTLPLDANQIKYIARLNHYGATVGTLYYGGTEGIAILRPFYSQGQGGLTVNCGLILGDLTGDPAKRPVTIDLIQNGAVKESIPNLVPGPGGYRFFTLQTGNFDVRIRAPQFLTSILRNVHFEAFSTTSLQATLVNGDCDNGNSVDLFDYLILSDGFDRTEGDPGFDVRADLDSDGVVSLFDYLILSNNFDREGQVL